MTKGTVNEKAAAKQQLMLDFDAATQAYNVNSNDKEVFQAFCLGVNMTMLTLKDLVEKPERRFGRNMTPELAADLYYEAAKAGLSED